MFNVQQGIFNVQVWQYFFDWGFPVGRYIGDCVMLTDTALKRKGYDILFKELGLVDGARFISLVLRDRFDYTEWQRDLYEDMSLEELFEKIKESSKKQNQGHV